MSLMYTSKIEDLKITITSEKGRTTESSNYLSVDNFQLNISVSIEFYSKVELLKSKEHLDSKDIQTELLKLNGIEWHFSMQELLNNIHYSMKLLCRKKSLYPVSIFIRISETDLNHELATPLVFELKAIT